MVKDKLLNKLVYYSLGITLSLVTFNISAKNIDGSCRIAQVEPLIPPSFNGKEINDIRISANQTQILSDGISRFKGNVVIEQHQLLLKADSADYDRRSETIKLTGEVRADTNNFSLDAASGFLSLKQNDSTFDSVNFKFPDSNLRGEAKRVYNDKESSRLSEAIVTSCTLKQVDWSLEASVIDLDHEDEYGSAKDAVMNFKGIPFLYMPYLEFPIGEKRRSGLLAPEIGNSNSRGFELATPWYWNIAPDKDVIFTPRYMSRRGGGLETKYRYLTDSSTGELEIAYLDNDSITNQARHFVQYRQNTDINQNANLNINYNDVSDTDYNNDFNNLFTNSNSTYLDKEVSLNINSDYWQASVLAHTAETLNGSLAKSRRPYRRLPQVTADVDYPLNSSGLSVFLNTEAVRFDHEDDSVVTGSRFTISPGFIYRLTGDAWHLTPSLELNHTQYETEDSNGNPVVTDDRTLPITSIDAGLYFERVTGDGLLQTLEPRVFYLNVPFKDQSNLPIFDTNLYDFTFDQLFRKNRFNGNDLIGDANQVSLTIGTKLFNQETGKELLNASIGQIIFLNDRDVTLPGGTIETDNTSDIIAELSGKINNWKLKTTAQWDTENDRTEKEMFSIHYKSKQMNIFNLSYRKRLDRNTGLPSTRHIDTSLIFPVSRNISLISRWDYSLKDDRDISVLGGISYDSCCWSMTLVSQRYLLNDKNQEYDSAIILQLVFKGIGSVSGNRINDTLKKSIPGYTEVR